jgi:copper chaperone
MITLNVEGMTCGGCAASVEKVIKKADPAAQVQVDLATGIVKAETVAAAEQLAKAITAAGFDTKVA